MSISYQLKRTSVAVALGGACLFQFTSCSFLEDNLGLSAERIIEGLKQALNIGTDAASSQLSAKDGFYMDAAAKILLPDEAQAILKNKDNELFKSLGITSKIDAELEKVVLNVNRSAEDAAVEAAPIFKKAITDLTVTDGMDILNGIVPGGANMKAGTAFDSTAATSYLKLQTLTSLTGVFAPKMDASLAKDLVGGVSANDAWDGLQKIYNEGVSNYNQAIDYQAQVSSLGGLFSLKALPTIPQGLSGINITELLNMKLGEKMTPLNVSLAEHCTNKALSAVFSKISLKEKDIRRDPYAFTDNLIQEVFGSVYKE